MKNLIFENASGLWKIDSDNLEPALYWEKSKRLLLERGIVNLLNTLSKNEEFSVLRFFIDTKEIKGYSIMLQKENTIIEDYSIEEYGICLEEMGMPYKILELNRKKVNCKIWMPEFINKLFNGDYPEKLYLKPKENE